MMTVSFKAKVAELNKEKRRDDELRRIVSDWAEKTAMHGLPNVQKATTKHRKIFWITILAFGSVMLVWQLTSALLKFYRRPTDTSINVVYSNKQPFPAVTLCNLNPLRKSVLMAAYENQMSMAQSSDASLTADASGGNDNMAQMMSFFMGAENGNNINEAVDPEAILGNSTQDVQTNASLTNIASTSTATPTTSSNLKDDAITVSHENNSIGNTGSENPTTRIVSLVKDDSDESDEDSDEKMFEDWDAMMKNDDYFNKKDAEYNMMRQYHMMYAKMSRQEMIRSGHSMADMLLKCSWNGWPCSPMNFSLFINSQYGNCFTFNSGENDDILVMEQSGPLYGLVLELYVEQMEYLPEITGSAGFRILIHNQTDMPFPEDSGHTIGPGTETNLAVSRKDYSRLEAPYGKCMSIDNDTNQEINAFTEEIEHVRYSSQACKKTCYQYFVMEKCACGDAHFPYRGPAFARVTRQTGDKQTQNSNDTTQITQNFEPCDITNATTEACLAEIQKQYAMNKLTCQCPPTCQEVVYETTISQGQWPAAMKEQSVILNMMRKSRSIYNYMNQMDDDDERADFSRRNLLKVLVYYGDLDYEVIATQISYAVPGLLSDIGGTISLWLGFSIITLFEVIEVMLDSCRVCYRKMTNSKTYAHKIDVKPCDGKC